MKLMRVAAFFWLFCGSPVLLIYASHPSKSALQSIRPDDIHKHIDFLASDSLLGRDTPSEGLNIAANYLAAEFERYGLEPLLRDYFQRFNVKRIRLAQDNHLVLETSDSETRFAIKRDFMPFGSTANVQAEGDLVFAGYGITAPEYHYDDYKNIRVRGKVVLILRHEPAEKQADSVFDGRENTRYSAMQVKVTNAVEHGAAALLMVTDPINHRSLRPRGFPWPSLYKNIPAEATPLTLSLSEGRKIPVIQVGKKFVEEVFGSVDSLRNLQAGLDRSEHPNSFELSGFKIDVKTSTITESTQTQNVVAFLEGFDPELKSEAIVIGAHYDHVGVNRTDTRPGTDKIFNGADDNASGTAGLLEIAQAFSRAPRPRRSVIFIAFAGEEKGLFGSLYYVETPLWPLEQTKAMLNMDMIGRNEGDKVSIIGFSHSPDLNEINTEANQYVGLTLEYDGEQFFRRSDQYNFARKKIPVLLYHTGEHDDYHKVTDHADKINAGKVAMISKLVFRTAWRAVDTDQTFHYVEPN